MLEKLIPTVPAGYRENHARTKFSHFVHTHFVLAWFSLYPAGTVGISFSNTLFSYAKYNFPSIQFQMLSIVSPVSLCKVFYCRKLIRYCSFVFILIYALYVPGML